MQAGVSVTWLPREGAEPGTNSLLLDAVSAVEWPDGRVFAWLAGEQATIRSLRRHLIRDRGIAKTDIDFTGYWKRGGAVRADS